ncbi:MAG: MG2 domain-containing protein, partial [Planctomycetota bacterium]
MLTTIPRKPLWLTLGLALTVALSVFVGGTYLAEEDTDFQAEGDRHFEEKSYRKAYENYQAYLKDNPEAEKWFQIKLRMGHCQAQLGRHEKAEVELTELADAEKLTDLQKARANYRLGHYFNDRPHYYYENSKKVKKWGSWQPDSRYYSTEKKDIKRAKDRLARSFDLLLPEAKKAMADAALEKDPKEAMAMINEAYNAGLDAAGALHTWQYQHGTKQKNVDYLDANGQKQTHYYYIYEFKDRDEILKRYNESAQLALDFKAACTTMQTWKKEFADGVLDALEKNAKEGHDMAALSLYRKGAFLVSLTQIDDWYVNNLLYHPELEDYNPLDSEYSPLPVFKKIYKDYHNTSYADDAQYFVGYCYQQVGQHQLAEKAYLELINDETFKKSTETSSARYNLQQIRAERMDIRTLVNDKEVKTDRSVRKWADSSNWQYRTHNGTNRSIFKKGETIGLWVETRNVEKFEVRALTFDMPGLMSDNGFLEAHAAGFQNVADAPIESIVNKYVGEKVYTKGYETSDDGRHNYNRQQFQLSTKLPVGSYMLEVDTGSVVNRRLIVVSDAQLVIQTYSPVENQAIMVDSETGAPLTNAKITYKRWDHYWQNRKYHWAIDVSRYSGDEQGRLRVPTGGARQWDGYLMYAEADGRYAFVQEGFPWWQQRGWNGNTASDTRMYSMTDRPVYRPGDSVHGKIILRQRNGGEWENVKGRTFRLQMYNAKGEEKFNKRINATSFGALEYDIDLASDAALGGWYYYLYSGKGNWIGSGNFQVEEYKKPEFEVSVSPPDKPVKLGNAISATIDAKYYFGGPASGATVKYKVYRNFYFHSVYFPRRYDWLYNWQPRRWYGTPDQQFHRNSSSELVTEGEGKLNQEGQLVIEWNTQKALSDWGEYDHQYRIEAEVTDSSRRTIVGNGSVKALRRAFFAFVDNKLGFYRPNDELDVEVRTVTADDKPVETKGKMQIYKVTFHKRTDEDGMPQIDEAKELLGETELNTNSSGRAQYTKPFTEPGTYDLVYVTKDEWDTEITGSARIIVKAEKWSPGSYRFNTISLIPQQKVYTEGEVAKVLLASDFETSWMLVSVMGGNEVLSQSFVNLKDTGGQLELELTVGREHLPNFHINVMTVKRGELHTKTVELFVPPKDQFLDVEVSSDKEWYQPGEKAQFTVTAKDSEGRPAVAEFAVSVYDRSITYIMSDNTPNIIKHFYGDRRSYRLNYYNSYNTRVGARQWDKQEYKKIDWFGRPLGWGVRNWLRWERSAFDFNNDKSKAEKYGRGFDSDEDRANKKSKGKNNGSEVPGEEGQGVGGGSGGLREKSRSRGGRGPADSKMAEQAESDGENADWGGAPEPSAAPNDDPSASPKNEVMKLADSLEELAKSENAATPRVRKNFKDSVYYNHRVVTGPDGKATITVEMPDNLTDWQINARGITRVAKVGEDNHNVMTTKKLILRDQAPRFFVEGDIVTLSGIIMNRYDEDMSVNARLQLNPTDTATEAEKNAFCSYQLFPETPGAQTVTVPANGEVRVDWQVKMTGAGLFQIRMLALSELESDATIKSYKCKVRGAEMYQAVTAVIEDDQKEASFEVNLPDALDPNQTNLDLQLSPSVAALAMDAIPYLLEFPYGCVEQTMSRFLPAVVVRKTLENAGISLEDIGKRRAQLEYEGTNPQAAYWYKRSPVFNSDTMNAIINAGIKRLSLFQHGDGGWGWWRGGRSDTYMSAYVVYGLQTAKEAGVKFDFNMLKRGVNFLTSKARTEKNLHRAAYISFVLSYSGKA